MRPTTGFMILSVLAFSACTSSHPHVGFGGQRICTLGKDDIGAEFTGSFNVAWNLHGPVVFFAACPNRYFPASIKLANVSEDSQASKFLDEYDKLAPDHSSVLNVKGRIIIAPSQDVSPFLLTIIDVASYQRTAKQYLATD